MQKKERQEGFYWVNFQGIETIARYFKNALGITAWCVLGIPENIYSDSDFSEINELQIKQNTITFKIAPEIDAAAKWLMMAALDGKLVPSPGADQQFKDDFEYLYETDKDSVGERILNQP